MCFINKVIKYSITLTLDEKKYNCNMIYKHQCVYNNSFHILQISNFIIHELLMHCIIEYQKYLIFQ